MPATRSDSVAHRSQPFPRISSSGSRTRVDNGQDVLSISSPEDLDKTEPLIPKASTSSMSKSRASRLPHRSPRRKSPFVPPPDEEIIEISSDDESPPPRAQQVPASVIAEHRRELSKMRADLARAKKDKARAEAEMLKMQASMKEKNQALEDTKKKLLEVQAAGSKSSSTKSFDPSILDEQLECDICTRRLWMPYTIPDCGHTFCESCLIEWFGVAHAQFVTAHPINPMQHELVHLLEQVLRIPVAQHASYIIEALRARLPPLPSYTCPSCRGPVTSRPVEDFSLKQVVHKVAESMGEKPPPSTNARNGKSVAGGVWDGFFPPIKKL